MLKTDGPARRRIWPAMLLALALLLPTGQASAAADLWSPVLTNGFGDANNRGVVWLQSFKGALYAGLERNPGTGFTSVQRSTDGTSFSPVTLSPPLSPGNPGVSVFGMVDDETRIYVAIAGPPGTSSSPLYRSTDGTSFQQVNGSGSGYVASGNSAVLPSPVIFNGNVYFGTRNPGGTQIWRRPVDDSAPWEKVFDAAALPAGAVSTTQEMTTWMWVFGGQVYAATTGGCGCGTPQAQADIGPAHLWRSASGDAGNWVDVLASGPGFGDADNNAIASMADLSGFLYASTTNRADAGQLWRSSDGVSWQNVVGPGPGATQPGGFGNPAFSELHNIETIDGRLWITTATPEAESGAGTGEAATPEIWRTSDGVNFVRSNDPGFGGQATGGFANPEGFAGHVYWGGRCSGGACLFRTTVDTDPPEGRLTRTPKKMIETDEKAVKVTFKFRSDEPGSTFLCKLDKAPEKPCTSPYSKKVKEGRHQFQLATVDRSGNRDPTPAKFKFKVEGV